MYYAAWNWLQTRHTGFQYTSIEECHCIRLRWIVSSSDSAIMLIQIANMNAINNWKLHIARWTHGKVGFVIRMVPFGLHFAFHFEDAMSIARLLNNVLIIEVERILIKRKTQNKSITIIRGHNAVRQIQT